MRAKLAPLVVLGIAAAGAWWLWSASGDGPFVPPSAGTQTAAPVPASASGPSMLAAAATHGAPDPGPASRAEVVRDGVPPVEPAPAVVRGRCVDPQGRALAGVKVTLHFWRASVERTQEHDRDHGPGPRQAPEPVLSGFDGRFELRAAAPPDHSLRLVLGRDDLVGLSAQWLSPGPGTVKDFGDVVLHPGVRVRGRAMDTAGAACANLNLVLDGPTPVGTPNAELMPTPRPQTSTGPDGTFEFAECVHPGRWQLHVYAARKRSPLDRVELSLPEAFLEVVVEHGSPLAGIVVDEEGIPVPRATIEVVGSRSQHSTRSAHDGRFVLANPSAEAPQSPVAIRVEHAEHEPLLTPPEYRWGERGIHLVLRRGLDLDVVVRRARDGTPVEDFGVRMQATPGPGAMLRSVGYELRSAGRHTHGVARLKGMRRGGYVLSVEPAPSTGTARVDWIAVEVRETGPRAVEVRLPDAAPRTVLVRRSDGAAVPGSKIELLRPPPETLVDANTVALALQDWAREQGAKAILVSAATTDADGTCTLSGPTGTELAVRVTGGAHLPLVVQPVRMEDNAPLVFTISAGATLTGRIVPVEVVGDLREQAGLSRDGGSAVSERGEAPALQLVRTLAGKLERFPLGGAQRGIPIGADGRFAVRGVPPGRWDLVMLPSRHGDARRGASAVDAVVQSGIELVDGTTTEVQLALGHWRRGRLRGTAQLNGAAHQGWLLLEVSAAKTERVQERWVMARCDAQGRFDVLLPAGRWQGRLEVRSDSGSVHVPAAETATIQAGHDTEHSFTAICGTQRLRILDAAGVPVPDLALEFRRDGRAERLRCPPTDAGGRTAVFGGAGTYELRVRRRSLLDDAAWQTFAAECQRSGTSTDSGYVSLGTITLPGDANHLDLRTPEEWAR